MAAISTIIRIVWVVVLTSEAFVIIISNIMALKIFLTKKFPKSATLLANLTVADILSGITPLLNCLEIIYSIEGKYEYCSTTINVAALNFSHFANLASLSAISVIAIERAMATFLPLKHHDAKRRYFFCGIVCSWILPSVILLFGLLAECSPRNSKVLRSLLKFIVIPSVCITMVSYIAVLMKMRFFPFHVFTTVARIQSRLSRTLIISSLVTLIATLPKTTVMAIRQNCKSCKNMPIHVIIAADCILYSSSFFNLLVYNTRIPLFRKERRRNI